jgi:hypothetical protein
MSPRILIRLVERPEPVFLGIRRRVWEELAIIAIVFVVVFGFVWLAFAVTP